jgi:hypothetical protein
MPEDRTSRGDVALWCLAGVMALVLFLTAPQLSADNTGRVDCHSAMSDTLGFVCTHWLWVLSAEAVIGS